MSVQDASHGADEKIHRPDKAIVIQQPFRCAFAKRVAHDRAEVAVGDLQLWLLRLGCTWRHCLSCVSEGP